MLKKISLTAATLALAMAVVGCSSDDEPDTQPQSSATSSQPATSGDPTPPPSQTPSDNGEQDRAGEVVNGDPLRTLSGKQITVRVNDKTFTIDLYDNPTVDDLLTRLPLTVKASNYPGYDEKVLRLSDPLSMEGAPDSDEPLIPEVGYYQPGQWIAFYYGPIGDWAGKVPVGQIDASVDELDAIPEGASITFEAA